MGSERPDVVIATAEAFAIMASRKDGVQRAD